MTRRHRVLATGHFTEKHRHGESMTAYALTAAHRTFPCRSMWRVTNLEKAKSIIVRVMTAGLMRGANHRSFPPRRECWTCPERNARVRVPLKPRRSRRRGPPPPENAAQIARRAAAPTAKVTSASWAGSRRCGCAPARPYASPRPRPGGPSRWLRRTYRQGTQVPFPPLPAFSLRSGLLEAGQSRTTLSKLGLKDSTLNGTGRPSIECEPGPLIRRGCRRGVSPNHRAGSNDAQIVVDQLMSPRS